MRNSKLVFLIIGILVGFVVTYVSTRINQIAFTQQVRMQAVTVAAADYTHSLVPLLINLEEEDLGRFEVASRNFIHTGIVIMHTNLGLLAEENREIVEGVLKSIAVKRSRLGVGKYASPPRETIEAMLVNYE